MSSTLLESTTSMIKIFQQYSNNDNEEDTLSKEELKQLLEAELEASTNIQREKKKQCGGWCSPLIPAPEGRGSSISELGPAWSRVSARTPVSKQTTNKQNKIKRKLKEEEKKKKPSFQVLMATLPMVISAILLFLLICFVSLRQCLTKVASFERRSPGKC